MDPASILGLEDRPNSTDFIKLALARSCARLGEYPAFRYVHVVVRNVLVPIMSAPALT